MRTKSATAFLTPSFSGPCHSAAGSNSSTSLRWRRAFTRLYALRGPSGRDAAAVGDLRPEERGRSAIGDEDSSSRRRRSILSSIALTGMSRLIFRNCSRMVMTVSPFGRRQRRSSLGGFLLRGCLAFLRRGERLRERLIERDHARLLLRVGARGDVSRELGPAGRVLFEVESDLRERQRRARARARPALGSVGFELGGGLLESRQRLESGGEIEVQIGIAFEPEGLRLSVGLDGPRGVSLPE